MLFAALLAVGVFLFVLGISPKGQRILGLGSKLESVIGSVQGLVGMSQGRTSSGSRDMFSVIEAGDIPGVERLLGDEVDPNVADDYGRTALIAAIDTKQHELVELLLKRGADPNRPDGRFDFERNGRVRERDE